MLLDDLLVAEDLAAAETTSAASHAAAAPAAIAACPFAVHATLTAAAAAADGPFCSPQPTQVYPQHRTLAASAVAAQTCAAVAAAAAGVLDCMGTDAGTGVAGPG